MYAWSPQILQQPGAAEMDRPDLVHGPRVLVVLVDEPQVLPPQHLL